MSVFFPTRTTKPITMTRQWLKSVSQESQQPSERRGPLKSMPSPSWGSGTPAWNTTWEPWGKMKTLLTRKSHLISRVAFCRYVGAQRQAIWSWVGSLCEHMVSLNQEPPFLYCLDTVKRHYGLGMHVSNPSYWRSGNRIAVWSQSRQKTSWMWWFLLIIPATMEGETRIHSLKPVWAKAQDYLKNKPG
jgi:hypothetical protein